MIKVIGKRDDLIRGEQHRRFVRITAVIEVPAEPDAIDEATTAIDDFEDTIKGISDAAGTHEGRITVVVDENIYEDDGEDDLQS